MANSQSGRDELRLVFFTSCHSFQSNLGGVSAAKARRSGKANAAESIVLLISQPPIHPLSETL